MRLHRVLFLVGMFALVLGNAASGAGQYYKVTLPASKNPGELQMGVTYTLWLPDGVKQVRAVIVHQHGCGTGACKGGETAAYDLHWQALAKKWDCALLGPSYHQGEKQNCRLWCDPRNGSEKAFLSGLQDLAKQSKHPEIADAPWCLWGHSGGGFWASLMQTQHPERCVAIWFRSGTAFSVWEKGEITKPTIPQAAYEVPMMLNPGVKEKGHKQFNGAWTGSEAMFKAYRAKGAPVGLAPDPLSGHECAGSRYLAIPFFDACLALRLPKADARDKKLRRVDQDGGWFAEPESQVALASRAYTGKREAAIWLPNEAVARAWMEYVKTGLVSDKTPPPAPLNVKVKLAESRVLLTWDAEADLESGLREFIIMRGEKELGRVTNPKSAKSNRPLFQGLSYHDTPLPGFPAMQFEDPMILEKGDTLPYQVIAVNGAGLRSVGAKIDP